MQQLKKSRSQQLLDRLFNNNIRQNYYDHHNMPARKSNQNFYKTTHASPIEHTKNYKGNIEIGRQLYPEIVKKIQDPGPGAYDWSPSKSKSFKFLTRTSLNRRVIPVSQKHKRIGPGFYNYDNVVSTNILSQNKKNFITVIAKSNKKQQRLAYQISKAPGPGKYENDQNLHRISSHSVGNTHKISSTARSSLIKNDKLPGPGYYQWDQYFVKNKEKKKPCIQYKFVYGHPS